MALYKKHQLGKWAEQRACRYLCEQGLHLLKNNYQSFKGEIDLIMQDRDDIVFIEVRSKSRIDYGSALESIHRKKQSRIINTAVYFLQTQGWLHKVNYRFDVVSLEFIADKWKIEWMKNAFSGKDW